jgi:hypothetical protein|tara:strand:- start:84 stop:350 length:267 start_codon:yes stop_codon:yes gene_type:complete
VLRVLAIKNQPRPAAVTALDNRAREKTVRRRHREVLADGEPASRLAENRHDFRVATESLDVALRPFQCECLIVKTVVSVRAVLLLFVG